MVARHRVGPRRPSGLVLGALLAGCASDPETSRPDPVEDVDPFIGTGGQGFGVGSIAPGPSHPFGLAKPSPDTSRQGGLAPSFEHCAGYWWQDDEIRAFSQMHLSGTGVPDYGVIGIMPTTRPAGPRLAPADYRARFSHRRESARVGRYAVELLEQGIRVELAATPRTALHRFDFPEATSPAVVVDLAHGLGEGRTTASSLSWEGSRLRGWVQHAGQLSGRFGGFRVYFEARLSATPSSVTLYREGRALPSRTATAASGLAARLEFGPSASRRLGMQVGLSLVSAAGARANLAAEDLDFDLDAAEQRAQDAWRARLERVRIDGADRRDRQVFYSALYRAHRMPTRVDDADGARPRFGAGLPGQGPIFSDFSLWDTFRTTHPLLTLIAPETQAEMNRSLLAMMDQGGHLPRWPLATGYTWTMVGSHAETVLIESARKGVGDLEPRALLDRLAPAAEAPVDAGGLKRASRHCLDDYLELGYCPLESVGGAGTRTLENAFGDALLAELAELAGQPERASGFRRRSSSWRSLLAPGQPWLQPRRADGGFLSPPDHRTFEGPWIEGNARQWSLFVPHDLAGLAEALGGREAFLVRLDAMFESAAEVEDETLPSLDYWHGNQVMLHAAWIFAELGDRARTIRWARFIEDRRYGDGPDGLAGNDDGGTLSSWYIWSTLGLFPKAGTDRYVLGAPRFASATVARAGRPPLRIVFEGAAERPADVRVRLDGEPVEGPYLRHAQLLAADELRFEPR